MTPGQRATAAAERRLNGLPPLPSSSYLGSSGSDAIDLTASSPAGLCVDLTSPSPDRAVSAEGGAELARRLASRWESEDVLCTSCHTTAPNPGFKWCAACYSRFQEQRGGGGGGDMCIACGSARANPGYKWCTACYSQHQARLGGGGGGGGGGWGYGGGGGSGYGGDMCTVCGSARANPGYEWCSACYGQHQARQGGGGRRGGSAASGAGPPENASYEELLAWEEARGAAGPPKGLSRGMIEGLPQRIFLGAEDALKGDEALCAVCQMEYEPGELLSLLPCTHAFHGSCVGRWLVQKPSCPVCMRDVKADMR